MVKSLSSASEHRLVMPGPPGILALSQLVSSIGDGLFYVCAALYFTRIIGLSPGQFGLGLGIGATFALLGGVPIGNLADRRGPRRIAILLNLCAASAIASLLFIRSFPLFILAATVYSLCSRGALGARQALLGSLVDLSEITKTRAYIISLVNVGIGIGAALGGLVILLDSRAGYLTAFLVDAVSFVAASLLIRRLPEAPVNSTRGRRRFGLTVIGDHPYLVVSLVNFVLVLHFTLVDVALPLWIERHTAAPTWMVAAVFLLNTVTVVAFQVRVAGRVSGLAGAVRFVRLAGVLLMASCAVYAASALGSSAWFASAVLLLAGGLMAIGEMTQTAGTSEISFRLAPPGKYGEYQGLFGMGVTSAQAVGPVLLTGLLVYGGPVGWLTLGGMFAVAGLLMRPAVRWAERTRDLAEPLVLVGAGEVAVP